MPQRKIHPANERMRSIINFYDKSLAAFGDKMGLSRASVSQFIHSDSISSKFLYIFRTAYPEINIDWVMKGEGTPFAAQQSQNNPDYDELIETLIKANNYQAQVIDKLWKEKKNPVIPFRQGNETEPSGIIPISERLRDFAAHSQVSFLRKPSMS